MAAPMKVMVLDATESLWNFAGLLNGREPWVDKKRLKKLNKKYKSNVDEDLLVSLMLPGDRLNRAHQYVTLQLLMSTGFKPTNVGIMFQDQNEYLTIMAKGTGAKTEPQKPPLQFNNKIIEDAINYDCQPINIVYFEPSHTKTVSFVIQWYGIFMRNLVHRGVETMQFQSEDDMCRYVMTQLGLKNVGLKNVVFEHIDGDQLMTINGVGPWDQIEEPSFRIFATMQDAHYGVRPYVKM